MNYGQTTIDRSNALGAALMRASEQRSRHSAKPTESTYYATGASVMHQQWALGHQFGERAVRRVIRQPYPPDADGPPNGVNALIQAVAKLGLTYRVQGVKVRGQKSAGAEYSSERPVHYTFGPSSAP